MLAAARSLRFLLSSPRVTTGHISAHRVTTGHIDVAVHSLRTVLDSNSFLPRGIESNTEIPPLRFFRFFSPFLPFLFERFSVVEKRFVESSLLIGRGRRDENSTILGVATAPVGSYDLLHPLWCRRYGGSDRGPVRAGWTID